MTTALDETRCLVCGKAKATFRCRGCFEEFCYDHLTEHRQGLNQQLDDIEINHDLLRESLKQQIAKSDNHELIQRINQWEERSIKTIQHTAEETRQILLQNIKDCYQKIETKLNRIADQLRRSRLENDFNEMNLRQYREELENLTKQLTRPSVLSIHQSSTPLIYGVSVDSKSAWVQNGVTIAGGNEKGNRSDQLNCPIGIRIVDDRTIYIADWCNHRTVEWKSDATDGRIVAGGHGKGSDTYQLNCPTDFVMDRQENHMIICDRGNRRVMRWSRETGTSGEIILSNIDCCGVAMDDEGHLYISNWSRDEVKRWNMNDKCGVVVAGGNGNGNQLNQLNYPTFIFVDLDHSVYVSDQNNHRVMKWIAGAKEGIVVAGGNGNGNGLAQLSSSCGLIVDHWDNVYVGDSNNHRIMCWPKGSTEGYVVIGRHGKGEQANQLKYPRGLSFDRQGNFYVADRDNHRVQRYHID